MRIVAGAADLVYRCVSGSGGVRCSHLAMHRRPLAVFEPGAFAPAMTLSGEAWPGAGFAEFCSSLSVSRYSLPHRYGRRLPENVPRMRKLNIPCDPETQARLLQMLK